MAVLRIPDEERTLNGQDEVRDYLAGIGIDYEKWETKSGVAEDASPEEILKAYGEEIDKLKRRGGYMTADVIDVNPATPGLEPMLAKFNIEHRHEEDEVRFIIAGRGLFHIHPQRGPVVAIEVEAGDLIRVPTGTLHWFDLCGERRIREGSPEAQGGDTEGVHRLRTASRRATALPIAAAPSPGTSSMGPGACSTSARTADVHIGVPPSSPPVAPGTIAPISSVAPPA